MTFADNLGHAMQVTNILRDVGEDLKVGRLYLPQDMMDKHGVTTDDLRHGRVTEGFKALFEELASVAETYYDGALEHLDLFPKDAQKPLGYAIILYRGIIEACRDSAYDVFNRRNHVDDATKKRLITAFQNRQKRRKS
jgi:phytoene synthase